MQLYYCCLVAVIFSIIYYGSADIQIYNLKTSQNLKSHYFFSFFEAGSVDTWDRNWVLS